MDIFAAPAKLQKLTIEITTLCNLKCAGCPRTMGINHGTWVDQHMDLGLFRRILDGWPVTGFVTLHGIGEPTLHPQFVELVAMARQSGKFQRMKVTSNGITRSPDYYAEAVRAGLDEFWISVDSFDPAIAERMRSGTKVEKLKANIAACLERKLPLHISMVVSAVNYRDIPETLRQLRELGAPPVHMQEFQDYGEPYGLMSTEQREEFIRLVQAAAPSFKGLPVLLPNFTRPKGHICSAPWFRPAITVQGYLTPCCTTFDPAQFGYTNVGEMSFAEAWQQPGLRNWIREFVQDRTPICTGCPLNPRAFGNDEMLGRSGKSGAELHHVEATAV
ncbi:MAG TPA: radical SAM protein [Ferrovibrio sp.]|jgi:MoaA/NifB/PqqE/SkfB family radical SAM enzyme|uniref:radical SAM protein n=1 Tax=Ferrovibrio sp. TaxID=1917215 RepID=UPI002B4AAFBE|nr:radical SAM protein [Ferrovibrio sp.]HLT76248.1 radical SAM protein [Ferrovibrio sp.]